MSKTAGVWNLDELYSGLDDPKIEADMAENENRIAAFVEKWRDRTDYLSDPAILRTALDDYVDCDDIDGSPRHYVALRIWIDTTDIQPKAYKEQLDKRLTVMVNSILFFATNIGKIKKSMQQTMLASAELAPYKCWLERQFLSAEHTLSDEQQVIVNELFPMANSAWSSMVTGLLSNAEATLPSEDKKIPFNNLGFYIQKGGDVGKAAQSEWQRIVEQYSDVATYELNTVVKTNLRIGKLRNYTRGEGPSFMRNDVTAATIDTMLETITKRNDLAHRIYSLKLQLLGKETCTYAERNLPYGALPNGYTFDQASELLRGVLNNLYPDFAHEFDVALENGRIDYVPRAGKVGGAMCVRTTLNKPSYLMLGFNGDLRNIKTLGHEFGHYLNNVYMQKGGLCNVLSYSVPVPLSEVASTFFEEYVLEAALAGASDETQLAVRMSSLEEDASGIFRQTAATLFEQDLYREVDKQGFVSKQQIGEMFAQNMQNYLGPQFETTPDLQLGWVHWEHFRMGFYNYGYTFAHLVSSAIQTQVNADPRYIAEFVRLLKTGRSQSTVSLLASLDLYIENDSVWNIGLDRIEQKLHDTTELARKLGKI